MKMLLRPYIILLMTTIVSFVCWLFPDFGFLRKGFRNYFSPDGLGLLLCFLWIVLAFYLSYICYKISLSASKRSKLLEKTANIDGFKPYIILSLLAWSGVVAVALLIFREFGLSGVFASLRSGNGNAFKDLLYQDYSIGVYSLRYIAVLAGALAVYHTINGRYYVLNILNFVSLGVVALISSRLSVIYTIIISLTLTANSGRKLKPLPLFFAGIVLVHIIFLLNYFRNINFYKDIGINNFYVAGFSEIITYLGSPFQGFLAAGTLRDSLIGLDQNQLSHQTGISFELNTNSALLSLVNHGGILYAFIIMLFTVIIGSVLIGFASKNRKSILYLFNGVTLYCFSEFWRLYLFNQGIFITLLVAMSTAVLLSYAIPTNRPSRSLVGKGALK